MSLIFSIAKILLTDQIKDVINIHLKKITDRCECSQFGIEIPLDNLDISGLSYDNAIKEMEMWKIVAKISIDLWFDYDYYRMLLFKSENITNEFKARLNNLGLIMKGDLWESDRKPYLVDVQTNVFVYCLYQLMIDKMALNSIDNQNDENERRQHGLCINSTNNNTNIRNDNALIILESDIVAADRGFRVINESIIVEGHVRVDDNHVDTQNNQISNFDTIKCSFCDLENKADSEIRDFCDSRLSTDAAKKETEIPSLFNTFVTNTKQNDNKQSNENNSIPLSLIGCRLSSSNESSQHQWTCLVCTFLNNSDDRQCSCCLNMLFGGNSLSNTVNIHTISLDNDPSNIENERNIDKSTVINIPEINSHQSSITTLYDGQQLQPNWICPTCSFSNQIRLDTCEACLYSIKVPSDIHKSKFDDVQKIIPLCTNIKKGDNKDKDVIKINKDKIDNKCEPMRNMKKGDTKPKLVKSNFLKDYVVIKIKDNRYNRTASLSRLNQDVFEEPWVCSKCTYKNVVSCKFCIICDYDRDNTNKRNDTKQKRVELSNFNDRIKVKHKFS